MIVRIITCERVWRDLLIRISEVDIPHVLLIEEHIRVVCVIVPEVVLVIFSLNSPVHSSNQEPCHSHKDVGVENGSD